MKSIDKLLFRQRYFDNAVHHPKVKDCISGSNEETVMRVLEGLGFKLGVDYVRQHPIGERFVLDFAFVKERVALEVDGRSHRLKRQRYLDSMRDSFLTRNGWDVIRIDDKSFFDGYKMSFYKSLIKQVVLDRRQMYQNGFFYHVDIPRFVEEDFTN